MPYIDCMPILANQRHELFAQNVAKGMSLTDAYREAGYKDNRQAASRLLTNVDIAARIDELKLVSAERAEITREYILRRIQGLADKAEEAGQFAPSLNALIKLGEEALDMFIAKTKSEHTFKGDPQDLSREQLAAIAAKANGHADRAN